LRGWFIHQTLAVGGLRPPSEHPVALLVAKLVIAKVPRVSQGIILCIGCLQHKLPLQRVFASSRHARDLQLLQLWSEVGQGRCGGGGSVGGGHLLEAGADVINYAARAVVVNDPPEVTRGI